MSPMHKSITALAASALLATVGFATAQSTDGTTTTDANGNQTTTTTTVDTATQVIPAPPTGIIELLDEPSRSAKKIRSAVTDAGREILYDEENKPGVSNLLTIYAALTGRTIDELLEGYDGKGYGDLKKDLAEAVVDFVRPVQERTQAYLDDPGHLDKVLAIGAEKARAVSAVTLATAYQKVGFLSPARGA